VRQTADQAATELGADREAMTLRIVTYANTRREPIEWLWPGRIAKKKITVIMADGGAGKSLLTCRLAAGVTRGDLGGDVRTPGRVLLVNMEDGDGDTTLPRLEAQGADTGLVEHLDHLTYESLVLPGDFERLRKHVHENNYQLVVLDPIAACLSPRVTFALDSSIRSAIMPVARLAAASGPAFVFVHHLNGRVSASAYRRMLGGTALANIVRAVYALGIHPDDRGNSNGRRVLAWVKGNLDGIDKTSIEFRLNETGRLEFGGIVPVSGDELLCERRSRGGSTRAAPQRDDAVSFLLDELSHGAIDSTELVARARARGIALRTLTRARGDVGVAVDFDGRGWAASLEPRHRQETVGVAPEVTLRSQHVSAGGTAAPSPIHASTERQVAEVQPVVHPPLDDFSVRCSMLELDIKDATVDGALQTPNKVEPIAPRTPPTAPAAEPTEVT
jgi:putative DNA primase/helicase